MSFKQLAIGASGIYIAYLTSSLLAQKMYSTPYQSIKDPEQFDKFTYPSLIVWFASLLCGIFGFLKGKANKQPPNPISPKEQVLLGFLYTGNILTTNYAILYISYLEQSLGRNCRYLMVVIVGAYFSRVKKGSSLKIPPKKIIIAAVITTGVLMFTLLGSEGKHSKHVDPEQAWKGYLLILVSIVFDALFSDSQAYSKATFKPTANHLFTSANFATAIIAFMFGLLKGESIQHIHFCLTHPSVIFHIFALSVLQVIGQISIYYVIANFKQHIFPLISTTRKVLTVLLSIFFFGHHVNIYQWLSILLVFGGLTYELQQQLNAKKRNQPLGKDQAQLIEGKKDSETISAPSGKVEDQIRKDESKKD